jgi:hypothetical protein
MQSMPVAPVRRLSVLAAFGAICRFLRFLAALPGMNSHAIGSMVE